MQPILLATDGSPSADEARRQAFELAALTGSPLTVVSVQHAAAPPFGAGYGYGSSELYVELANTERRRVHELLAELERLAAEAGIACTTVPGEGNPVEVICRVAKDTSPRLLVVGAHGWGLVQRIVYGSVSTGLLHHAPCPILVVPAPAAVLEHRQAA